MTDNKRLEIKSRLGKILDFYTNEGLFSHAYLEIGHVPSGPLITVDKTDHNYVFDLASLTKALVTTPLVFKFFGENLEIPVNALDPELVRKGKTLDLISLKQLLSHKSGLPAWFNFWINGLSESTKVLPMGERQQFIAKNILRSVRYSGHREEFVYSDVGFILLGYLLEKHAGESLDALFYRHLVPKGFVNKDEMFFGLLGQKAESGVKTAYCPLRNKILQGEVHDENAAVLGGVAGHAGLFASGRALSEYLRNLCTSDLGKQLFCANIAMLRDSNNIGLLGWKQAPSSPFAKGRSIGHNGFTGTDFWIDSESETYLISLTNRVSEQRISPSMSKYRRSIFEVAEKFRVEDSVKK